MLNADILKFIDAIPPEQKTTPVSDAIWLGQKIAPLRGNMAVHILPGLRMLSGAAGFDWDQGNRDKCRKHGVSLAVIESLFHGSLAMVPDPAHSAKEERFKAAGRTSDGRGVLVVFTLRKKAHVTFIRPISAR
jgi:uncharacterized protein